MSLKSLRNPEDLTVAMTEEVNQALTRVATGELGYAITLLQGFKIRVTDELELALYVNGVRRPGYLSEISICRDEVEYVVAHLYIKDDVNYIVAVLRTGNHWEAGSTIVVESLDGEVSFNDLPSQERHRLLDC